MYIKFIISIIALCMATLVKASSSLGIGTVAQNMMEPVTMFSDFIDTGCMLVGGAFVFASIIKYFEYRRSPLMVSISTVIFLFIAGVILLLLPFASYLTSSGVQFRLFN